MTPGVLLLCLALAGPAGARADDLDAWVRTLDAARDPDWSAAFDQLVERGPEAAARVLVGFEAVDFPARRGRAKVLLKVPRAEHCAQVLQLIGDPDPHVRRLLVRWLGDLALADAEAARRVAELERLGRDDPAASVRVEARRSLAECGLVEAVPALDRLVLELPAGEAGEAAAALAAMPTARERLVARVISVTDGEVVLPSSVFAQLLHGYGRALAEVPLGGNESRERRPFLVGRAHPSREVQAAAGLAWNAFVARAAELTEPERADLVLARLAEEGWPPEQCLRRRLDLAWRDVGDPVAGGILAGALLERSRLLPLEDRLFWETQARFFQGAALFATEPPAQAEAWFGDLVARLTDQRARRLDLFDEQDGRSPGGSWTVDRLHLLALASEWQGLARLAAGDEPGCARALRAAHEVFLDSRAVAQRTGETDPYTLDVLFDRDLSPQSLVLFNERLGPGRRAGDLALALRLAGIWAGISPVEMLGFEPRRFEPRELADPLLDPARLSALQALRDGLKVDLERQRREALQKSRTDPQERLMVRLVDRRLEEIAQAEVGEALALANEPDPGALSVERAHEVFAQLATYLGFSMHALGLAAELRVEGDDVGARAIAERALAALRSDPGAAGTVYVEWASARFELLRGASFMDENRPAEAEQVSLEAIRRLEAMENTFLDREDGGGGARDAQLRMVRALLADAWMSLAVNANVRQHDTAKALEYFEKAYDLNQNPFMRVLRACYRARSGRAEEARAILASVTPSPSLFYNTACTYALLGDVDLAIDFLERDFRENYPTPGSLARQREWARNDPDLVALRDDPRFARLTSE